MYAEGGGGGIFARGANASPLKCSPADNVHVSVICQVLGTNSGSVVKEGKAPPPATPTTMHARTMRRNIRGETPLHVASIKVGTCSATCLPRARMRSRGECLVCL